MSDTITVKGFHFYREDEKWLVKGFTYGPFAPDHRGEKYPDDYQLRQDFTDIIACGANCLRLYDLPNDRVAAMASEFGISLIVDIPWPKHLDVFEEASLQKVCFDIADDSVRKLAKWKSVIGIFLGNEIPSDYLRWHGPRKVERFLRQMYDQVKTLAPDKLIGFANYPSTEYLNLDFLDFVGFNVYLDDPEELRFYLIRLRHLYPNKPLLLSECGLDSKHHGEENQKLLVPAFLRVAYETGLVGAMVFAWTDEWHTGGITITDWDFGLVDRERGAKPALADVKAVYESAPQNYSVETFISIVIASYNGAQTLRECLESIQQLKYQHFETIVVDDGSTDDTAEILDLFPWVIVVRQPNRGLSAARNAGIEKATGEIVAFTDSDCVVDKDWLYFIALFLHQNPHMAGVGGPNITPMEKSVEHRAVSLAPGHATHVLLTHAEAEHVPGCNMAFRREALNSIARFDETFRKAGDDVDLIWRLQNAGFHIGFSTAAFVWHHRRPTMRAYVNQQIGYGEAESLLLRKHPQKFNDRGQSVWRGVIYPSQAMRPLLLSSRVQYGIFGTAGYQCIYHTRPAPWWYYATSLEWWIVSIALVIVGIFAAPVALVPGILGVTTSLALSTIALVRNWPHSSDFPKAAFPLAWILWVIHPVVRSGARYWYRLKHFPGKSKLAVSGLERNGAKAYNQVHRYWCEQPGEWRAGLIAKIETTMLARQWVCAPNGIWDKWDLSVVLSAWYKVRVLSSEETHGGQKRLLKMRYVLVPTNLFYLCAIGVLVIVFCIALYNTIWARWVLVGLIALALWAYRFACRGREDVAILIEELLVNEGYISVPSAKALNVSSDRSAGTSSEIAVLTPERGTENV